jgi:hypothetical protein
MSTRGLPGFLRRSRQWGDDFGHSSGDESVDDDDNSTNNNNVNKDNDDNGRDLDRQSETKKESWAYGLSDSEQVHNALSFLDPSPLAETSAREDVDAGTETDQPYGDKQQQQQNASMTNASGHMADSSDDLSSLGDADLSASITASVTHAKPSYRETQFEKILSDNVVKLSELRKIGWNGIPVSTVYLIG